MKVKITCPKCNSEDIIIVSTERLEDPTPLYKCNKCGHKHRLFPQLWDKKPEEEKEGEKGEE
jgi:Zn ribbon nucleic-acid-binding protein